LIFKEVFVVNNQLFAQLLDLLAVSLSPNLKQENAFLKAQLEIVRKRLPKIIKTTPIERAVLLRLGKNLGERVRNTIEIVQYDTYRSWIRNESLSHHCKPLYKRGRKSLARDTHSLILQMARANLWGYNRIKGELFKIGLAPSKSTIKNVLRKHNVSPVELRKTNDWHNYLKRHFQTLWACDFFTKEILTPFGKKIFYILFFVNIKTKQVRIAGITKNPTNYQVYEQILGIIPQLVKDNNGKIALIRDRDSKYPKIIDKILEQHNITTIKTPYRSPNMNAYAESFVDKIKGECLNHFLVFDEKHLRYLLKEYVEYYNKFRPHQGLNNKPLDFLPLKQDGVINYREILGGLHHHYFRE